MKCVWIIKHYGSIPDVPGGARQYEFAKGLAQKGFRVAYFLPSFSHGLHAEIRQFDNPLYDIQQRDGIDLVWIKAFPYFTNNWRRAVNAFDFAWRLKKVAQILSKSDRHISCPDKILCFNLPLLAPLVAQSLAKKFKAQFYLEIGDLWPQTLVDMGVLSEKNPITWGMRQMERFLYKKVVGIITPLPNASDYVQTTGFGSKVTFIGSGIDLANYDYQCFSDESGGETKQFTIVYTGAHGPANDLLPVIKAFARVYELGYHQIKFVLVGDGVQKPMLREYVHLKDIKNVFFKDAIPKREIPSLLMKADAFLYRHKHMDVHKYGINPNKLNDYICAGKPILFFADGKNNIVDEIGCGLTVKNSDPENMARAIIQLANLPVLERDRMAHRARRYAEEHLSIDLVIDRLAKALNLKP